MLLFVFVRLYFKMSVFYLLIVKHDWQNGAKSDLIKRRSKFSSISDDISIRQSLRISFLTVDGLCFDLWSASIYLIALFIYLFMSSMFICQVRRIPFRSAFTRMENQSKIRNCTQITPHVTTPGRDKKPIPLT